MRRADIARLSHISAGADYIFTLPKHAAWARGQRVIAAIDLSRDLDTTRHLTVRFTDRSVVTGSSQETCTQTAQGRAERRSHGSGAHTRLQCAAGSSACPDSVQRQFPIVA